MGAGLPSETDLCNLALLSLGASTIESLDENSDQARLCKAVYPDARDELLAEIEPPSAVTRATLAQSTSSPLYDWTYAYAVPSGCLKILGTDDESEQWKREGNTILSDRSTLKIEYVQRLTDVTKFGQAFKQALIAYVTARICYAITKSASLTEQHYKLYEMAKMRAHEEAGQESSAVIFKVGTLTSNVRDD